MPDQLIIRHNEANMNLSGDYQRNTLHERVSIYLARGEKKVLRVNNNDVRKFSDHIGLYPLVMISPDDILLIHEGGEERRKFMDGIIAQTDRLYLENLLLYNRALDQRNRLLKSFARENHFDGDMLSSYDLQLVRYGTPLFVKRKEFLQTFIPVFRSFYQTISSSHELVNLNYTSHLDGNDFSHLLRQHEAADLSAQRTTKGIHKDDLEFIIDDFPLKKFGSQGQQKSFIIALKLAQFDWLFQQCGIKPLLLLDDIFEKLDGERLNKLLGMMEHHFFGQIFLTDTDLDRVQKIFSRMPSVDTKYFSVDEGIIHEL